MIWCHRLSNNKLQQASESRDPRNRKQLLTLLAPRTWPAERQSLNHHMCTWLTCPFWTVSPDPASFIKCATVCGQQTNKQNPFGVIPALTNGHGALLLGRLCVTMSCFVFLSSHWMSVLKWSVCSNVSLAVGPAVFSIKLSKLNCCVLYDDIAFLFQVKSRPRPALNCGVKVFSLTWAEGRRTWAKFDKYSLPVSRVCQLFLPPKSDKTLFGWCISMKALQKSEHMEFFLNHKQQHKANVRKKPHTCDCFIKRNVYFSLFFKLLSQTHFSYFVCACVPAWMCTFEKKCPWSS